MVITVHAKRAEPLCNPCLFLKISQVSNQQERITLLTFQNVVGKHQILAFVTTNVGNIFESTRLLRNFVEIKLIFMEEMVKFRKKETLDEYDIHTTSAFDNVVYVSLKKFYRRHYKEATGHTEEWVDERILTVFNNAYKVYHDLVDGAEISSLTVREKSLIMPNGELLEKELYYPQTAMPMLYFLLREYADNIEDNFRKDAIEKCMKNLHDAFVDDTEFFAMLQEAFCPEVRFCGYRRFVIAADVESVLAALHEKLDAVQGGKDRVSVLLDFEEKGYLEPYFDEKFKKNFRDIKMLFWRNSILQNQ